MTQIAGKNVLVTGGASGIGRLVALKAARLGANPIVWDIDPERLERVVAELRAAGPNARGCVCDVADRQQVYAAAARVRDETGPVQVLVNNAGVVTGRRFLDAPDEALRRGIEVNALSHFWTAKAFLPDMIRAGGGRGEGHIVTVASAAGLIGVAGLADYCAGKWAAVGFDEALRAELRQTAPGVRTTVVCPYFVDTGMFRGVRTGSSLLLPILREEDVAERIVRAIRRNRRRVVMPWMVRLLPLVRFLSLGLLDATADLLGVNRAMDHFVGRGGPPEPPAACRE